MGGRKTFILLLGILLLFAALMIKAVRGEAREPNGPGGATRAVLLPPDSLPADDPDKDASGYAKATLQVSRRNSAVFQTLMVEAHDLVGDHSYRIEVADRTEDGAHVVNLGVFLTDENGELRARFSSMARPNAHGTAELRLGQIRNVLAIDGIRVYRVEQSAEDGSVTAETLVLQGKFGSLGGRGQRS